MREKEEKDMAKNIISMIQNDDQSLEFETEVRRMGKYKEDL